MKETENLNIVEMFREKTEETDLKQYLKSTFGGYTKKSVHEYLNILRKQQQLSNETFSNNLQILFEEKESIRKNNDSLLARYNKLSAEYDNLAESCKNVDIDDSDFTEQNIIALKNKIVQLEEEVKITDRDKITLEKQIEHLNKDIEDLIFKLDQSKKETEAQRQMLKAERSESKKQRDMVADLSRLLEDEKAEIRYLKGVVSDGRISQLTAKVNELTEQLDAQTKVIEKLNSKNDAKNETIETMSNEIDVLKLQINNLTNTVDKLNTENYKLLLANKTLSSCLQEEYKKSIELIKEKTNALIDKFIANKKLSDSESEYSLLKLEIEKIKNNQEIKNINEKSSETSETV